MSGSKQQKKLLKTLTDDDQDVYKRKSWEYGRKIGLYYAGPLGVICATIILYTSLNPVLKGIIILGIIIIGWYLSGKYITRT